MKVHLHVFRYMLMFSICVGHVGLILCVLGFGSSGPGLNPVGSPSGRGTLLSQCLLSPARSIDWYGGIVGAT